MTQPIGMDDGGQGSPAFLLLHSLGGRRDFWSGVLPILRERHRAVAVDLRGHGAETAEKTERTVRFGLDDFAGDVLAAADAAGLQRFILVGHSFGALVALAVAARVPSRVIALALVDAGGSMDGVPAAALEDFLAGVAGEQGAGFVREAYEANLERATPATRARVLESLAATDQRVLVGGYTALFSTNPLELLAQYPGPVKLSVDSANDSPMALHAQHGELDVTPVEGTSHWIPLDQPAALASLLLGTGDRTPETR